MEQAERVRAYAQADRRTPELFCDVVMKGGITSGVVYPHAVCELANTYRLKNIGGTSAGAIAAVAAAAAEYGRGAPGGGFQRLAQLPDWLGTGKNLFNLFQPQRRTRALFKTFTAGIGKKGVKRVVATLVAAVTSFPLWIIAGALPGVGLIVATARSATGALSWWGIVCGVLLVVAGVIAGVLTGVYLSATKNLAANGFGMCAGHDDTAKIPPLTDWLDGEVTQIAGRAMSDPPLTFGDLWSGPPAAVAARASSGAATERYLSLEMMTTNVTHGRPYRIPFESRIWFFDPRDFEKLFPTRIVEWMKTHPPAPPEQPAERRWWELQCKLLAPLLPLPESANLPIVVAARMSLSFPMLISAVPLWAVDWTWSENQRAKQAWLRWSEPDPQPAERLRAGRCWFSDGGIASNFPVHFFDSPLPRWPTFAINLRRVERANDDQCMNVYMPNSNEDGIAEAWAAIGGDVRERPGSRAKRKNALLQFGHAILDTMQNWSDNTQLRVPGYRDRIAHVGLTKEEGGMNLNMPRERIEDLTERGACAAQEMVRRFTGRSDSPLDWENHRWLRYRSSMNLMQELIKKFAGTFSHPANGPSYAELIERMDDAPPPSYRWARAEQRAFAAEATKRLVALADEWAAAGGQSFAEGAPRPVPELRVRPRF